VSANNIGRKNKTKAFWTVKTNLASRKGNYRIIKQQCIYRDLKLFGVILSIFCQSFLSLAKYKWKLSDKTPSLKLIYKYFIKLFLNYGSVVLIICEDIEMNDETGLFYI